MFEITWLVVHVDEDVVTINQADEEDVFVQINQKFDLAFLGADVLRIQWSAGPEPNFIQKIVEIVDEETEEKTKEVRDFPLEKLTDIPNWDKLHQLIDTTLKEDIPPEPTLAEKLDMLRGVRSDLLQEADITILRFLENGEAIPPEWAKYRQDLRNLPSEIESGNLPEPTVVNNGSEYFPDFAIQFNSWPVKP